jgi:hypothetical protein
LTEPKLKRFSLFEQVVHFFICSDRFVVQKDINTVKLGILLETSVLELSNSRSRRDKKPGVAMGRHS